MLFSQDNIGARHDESQRTARRRLLSGALVCHDPSCGAKVFVLRCCIMSFRLAERPQDRSDAILGLGQREGGVISSSVVGILLVLMQPALLALHGPASALTYSGRRAEPHVCISS